MFKAAPGRLLVSGGIVVGLLVLARLVLVDSAAERATEMRPVRAAPFGENGGFHDIAREAGIHFRMGSLPREQGEHFKINLYDHGCGVAVADVDGDGFEDIYFANQLGRNALLKNRGDGTFVDITHEAGVELGDRVCVGVTFADIDNDGRPDLYVTSTRGGNVLFKNMGGGKFTDVTRAAGLTLVRHCQTAAFFDYDNDGFLDLFVTCTAQWTSDPYDSSARYYPGLETLWRMADAPREENVLYHNNGDGTFTDVTARAGLKGQGWGGDVAAFDYDEDGRVDLLVTNMFGHSQLYRNNGDGSFTDVTSAVLGRTSWGAIGCKVFDHNNDGKLDLLIVDMHSDMWPPIMESWDKSYLEFVRNNESVRSARVTGPESQPSGAARLPAEERGLEQKFAQAFRINYDKVIFGNTFFRNVGGGKFQEITESAGLETFWPWGVVTGDFDNDGYEDVFLPSGMGYPFFYWPNRLLMNQGNGTFKERSRQEGIEPPARGRFQDDNIGGRRAARSSRCAAVADFRNAGRLDIVTNNFNDLPYYFQNSFPAKNFIAFQLQGNPSPGRKEASNRDAVGAVVRLYVGDEVMVRQVHAAGGYLSQSSRRLHFGLGNRTRIDRVDIRWPSGLRQRLSNLRINQLHHIVEPEPA